MRRIGFDYPDAHLPVQAWIFIAVVVAVIVGAVVW